MEIRVHGPGQEPAAAGGHDAHARQRLRARGRLLRDRGRAHVARRPRRRRVLPRARARAAGVQRRHRCGSGARSTSPGRERNFVANASCGLCGKTTLDQLEVACAPVADGPGAARGRCCSACPTGCATAQTVFDATGGLHAAACFSADGDARRSLREDVGRHNAVDKLVGHARRSSGGSRWPTRCSSSPDGSASRSCRRRRSPASRSCARCRRRRASRSTWRERFGQTLVGFVRDGRANVYTRPERIDLGGVDRVAWKGSAQDQVAQARPSATCGSGSSRTASARRSRTTTPRWPSTSGRTAATSGTRGGSCARACATAARSASPASTTGRSRACTSARRASTSSSSTRWTRSTRRVLADVARAARASTGKELRDLGRLPYPMVRQRGRARVSRRVVVGRSPRPDRRRDPRRGPRPPRALPHRARHHQRGVLRRAEGDPVPRHATTSTTRRGCAMRRRPSR